jgi:hypothetical protein
VTSYLCACSVAYPLRRRHEVKSEALRTQHAQFVSNRIALTSCSTSTASVAPASSSPTRAFTSPAR